MRNALSIDLEEWFHAELVRPHVRDAMPQRRVVWAVEPVLELLDRYRVRATFFVVGDVMRHQPELVQRLYREGHEIGCHGWSHRPLWALAPERFARELDEFDREAASIMPVEEIVGFRAPTFSLDERSGWAIDVLKAHGYRYDSSIFPMRTYLYGVEGCPPRPYRPTSAELTRDHAEGELIEFPMTTYRLGDWHIPVAGGFYLRAMPWFILGRLLAAVNRKGYPFVIYAHPWEMDSQTPRVRGLSLVNSFVTYYNPAAALQKLERLLRHFSFAPLRDVLGIREGRHSSEEQKA